MAAASGMLPIVAIAAAVALSGAPSESFEPQRQPAMDDNVREQREVHSNSVWIDVFTDFWWIVKPPPPLPHEQSRDR